MLGIKTYPAFAGADRVVEKIIENLRDDACSFEVYVLKGARDEMYPEDKRVRLIHIPSVGGKHLRPWIYFLLSTLHCLFNTRIRTVHIHNSDFGLFCILLRLRLGLRLIGTFHGNPYERRKWGPIARMYLRFSELCFVNCCHVLTTVARSKLDDVPKRFQHKMVYIPNGVEPCDIPSPEGCLNCAQYGVEENKYIMFACGRLDATKGLHLLLEAQSVRKGREKVLVIGDFSHDPSYTAGIMDAYGASEDIVFVRTLLPREVLMDALRKCRVFVFPSEVEAMSMMLLEAISCRVPVVCSDIAENVEVVGADYAYLFRSGSPEDLAAVLTSALAGSDCAEKAERLFDRCMERFAWSSLARHYAELYARAFNGANSPDAPPKLLD